MVIFGIIILICLFVLYVKFCNVLAYIVDPISIFYILIFSFFSSVIVFGFRNVFKSFKIGFINFKNSNKEEIITSANIFLTMLIFSLLSGLMFSIIGIISLFTYYEDMKKAKGFYFSQELLPILYGIVFSITIYLPIWLRLKNEAKKF
ncbi:MAG: hypothetical protein GYA61_03620 [Spirochaetales bacterium]|nr:hypothetical protein [Exilispira sp.]NMC67295.1 hypothetical protein [Spirochaetales bacterium]